MSNVEADEIDILGVSVASVTIESAAEILLEKTTENEKYFVFTPNPEMVDRSLRDKRFCRLLHQADLLVADGVGLLWASRILSTPLPGTVPGVDLMNHMLDVCADKDLSVYFLGTTENNVRQAAEKAEANYPGLTVAGYHHGFFTDETADTVIDELHKCCPNVVVTGMGVPKEQEFLISNSDSLPAGVYLGVGGGLDVLAGAVKRAPFLVRRLGLEWLYMLFASPRRWRRQTALIRFALAVLQCRLTRS